MTTFCKRLPAKNSGKTMNVSGLFLCQLTFLVCRPPGPETSGTLLRTDESPPDQFQPLLNSKALMIASQTPTWDYLRQRHQRRQDEPSVDHSQFKEKKIKKGFQLWQILPKVEVGLYEDGYTFYSIYVLYEPNMNAFTAMVSAARRYMGLHPESPNPFNMTLGWSDLQRCNIILRAVGLENNPDQSWIFLIKNNSGVILYQSLCLPEDNHQVVLRPGYKLQFYYA